MQVYISLESLGQTKQICFWQIFLLEVHAILDFLKNLLFEILISHESDSLETWHASSRDPHGKKLAK